MAEEKVLSLEDVATLRALANPLRQRLLNHLMSFGERTASQCGEVVGASASNCSYHLRELERFGLVTRREATDGRERPWRAHVTGLRVDPTAATDPAQRTAALALEDLDRTEADRLAGRAAAQRATLPADWRAAGTQSTYGLLLSPAELADLVAKLDALIRPFIAMTRDDAPVGADAVHVRLDAFRHPDAGGTDGTA